MTVQQLDGVLAEPGRIGGRAAAQRGDGAGGAGCGDGRAIGEQGEPGQLQIEFQSRRGRGAAPPQAANSGPVLDGGKSGLLAGAERRDAPGGQRVGGQAGRAGSYRSG